MERKVKIKGVILDVDGTLTDGKKYYFNAPNLTIAKSFSVRDGKGIDLAQKKGIKFAIITADKWELITERAKDLKISDLFYNCHNKIEAVNKFISLNNLKKTELCFIGDDVNDIPLMKIVALPIAVGDAVDAVKEVCSNKNGYITKTLGGNGAVREALEYVMRINDESN